MSSEERPEGFYDLRPLQRQYFLATMRFGEALGIHCPPMKKIVVRAGKQCGFCGNWRDAGAWWGNGVLALPANLQDKDVGVIAHELGHRLHEVWRKTSRWGEDFSNAVRWFVEQEQGPTHWCDNPERLGSVFLLTCNFDRQKFATLVTAGEPMFVESLKHLYS